MEKMIIFLPIILFFGFFGLLVFGFLFFVLRLIFKSKNSAWSGKVIDKKSNAVRDHENPRKMNYFYWLVVKTEEGKEMKVGLSRQMWDTFSVGDNIEKPKGSLYPSVAKP